MLPPNAGRICSSRFLWSILRFRIRHILDLQVGAVGGHAGAHFGSNSGGEVSSYRRGSVEHDLRSMLFDQLAKHAGVGIGLEMAEPRIVDDVNVVAPMPRHRRRAILRQPSHPGYQPVRAPCHTVRGPRRLAVLLPAQRKPKLLRRGLLVSFRIVSRLVSVVVCRGRASLGLAERAVDHEFVDHLANAFFGGRDLRVALFRQNDRLHAVDLGG
jgi:hypothetical protein